jgi:hypothetical protein
MKRRRFDFFLKKKEKKKRIKRFVLTKMKLFRFMSVRLISQLNAVRFDKSVKVRFGSVSGL